MASTRQFGERPQGSCGAESWLALPGENLVHNFQPRRPNFLLRDVPVDLRPLVFDPSAVRGADKPYFFATAMPNAFLPGVR